MKEDLKLAILIDAENISYQYIDIIMNEANTYGNIVYKRIYGNWTLSKMDTWKDVILDYAIHPIQQYSNTSGKNASDSCLIIDTMDLLYTTDIDGYCIISSDSDFTRLASRLRESNKFVLGMGESKTPRSFISACNKFLYLDVIYKEQNKKPSKTKAKTNKIVTEIDNTTSGMSYETIVNALVKIAEEKSSDEGWISSGLLGNYLLKQFPDFDARNFGHKKLVPFIRATGLFDYYEETIDENKNVKHSYFKIK
ncbi:MAG: NYN domain-containing protein [Erysipelotrichaceae bacterium]|nr:NYN domain-containing protein [Erysipelotrichaceae bacterium]